MALLPKAPTVFTMNCSQINHTTQQQQEHWNKVDVSNWNTWIWTLCGFEVLVVAQTPLLCIALRISGSCLESISTTNILYNLGGEWWVVSVYTILYAMYVWGALISDIRYRLQYKPNNSNNHACWWHATSKIVAYDIWPRQLRHIPNHPNNIHTNTHTHHRRFWIGENGISLQSAANGKK